MNANVSVQPTVAPVVKHLLAVLTVLGIVGVVLATMLGFEEPHAPMLWGSATMLLAAPVAALAHLGITRGLTREEKRIWLKEFASAEVWSALSEYLSSTDLSESARRRAQERLARREST